MEIKRPIQDVIIKPTLVDIKSKTFSPYNEVSNHQKCILPIFEKAQDEAYDLNEPLLLSTKEKYISETSLKKSNSMTNLAKPVNSVFNEKCEMVFSDIRHYTHCDKPTSCTCRCVEKFKCLNENRSCGNIGQGSSETFAVNCTFKKIEEKHYNSNFPDPCCNSRSRVEIKGMNYQAGSSQHSIGSLNVDCRCSLITSSSNKYYDSDPTTKGSNESHGIVIDGIQV